MSSQGLREGEGWGGEPSASKTSWCGPGVQGRGWGGRCLSCLSSSRDSYWVMEGLLLSEMPQTVKGMLQNFLDLVQT